MQKSFPVVKCVCVCVCVCVCDTWGHLFPACLREGLYHHHHHPRGARGRGGGGGGGGRRGQSLALSRAVSGTAFKHVILIPSS